MAGHALITIDGVLAEQGDEPSFAASKFLSEGGMLYHALCSVMNVSLVSLQPEDTDDRVQHWLRTHGFRAHVQLHYDRDSALLGHDIGIPRLLSEVRRSGPLDLVIEASPERAARLLHHGAATLIFAKPAYARDEFHPESRALPREWGAVLGELDAQMALTEKDTRIREGTGGTRFTDG